MLRRVNQGTRWSGQAWSAAGAHTVSAFDFPIDSFPIRRDLEAFGEVPAGADEGSDDLVVRSQAAVCRAIAGSREEIPSEVEGKISHVPVHAGGWTLDVGWVQPVTDSSPVARVIEMRV